ncbi:hypothetical protein P153DRAFT_361122 [Dothidotthia symphoricarpi CBS 119687]|uniref:Uncharacterized protein n=1 Tax=Dothidotthia symphoricarpi CBS 119687 TaxID=1392245 RepID=A0A6A5ZYP0_9PLEO|nr:uncharacterized protein P153DRAFT_361122 [Dothidotthia symphoricarpi CBS 119687]KAF2124406.1 hypothetical protein P153DRAFT_361122 [Dothidotthia symphoricarpi CBS 119687]
MAFSCLCSCLFGLWPFQHSTSPPRSPVTAAIPLQDLQPRPPIAPPSPGTTRYVELQPGRMGEVEWRATIEPGATPFGYDDDPEVPLQLFRCAAPPPEEVKLERVVRRFTLGKTGQASYDTTTAVQYDEWQVKFLADLARLDVKALPSLSAGQPHRSFLGPPFAPGELASVDMASHHVGRLVLVAERVDPRSPRYESFKNTLAEGARIDMASHQVDQVLLIAEGLKENVYGYEWAWEDLVNSSDIEPTSEDIAYTNAANHAHFDAVTTDEPFLHSGGYRSLLSLLVCWKLMG